MPIDSSIELSVVLPAKDEEENIALVLDDAFSQLPRFARSYEVIVVNDGSQDNTLDRLEQYRIRQPRLTIINLVKNKGYGFALKTGFNASSGKMLFFTDCDFQFRLSDLGPMIACMQTQHLDGVVGYRMGRQDTPVRIFYSWVYNRLVCRLFDFKVKDVNCAFKLFRRDAIVPLALNRRDYLVNVELLSWISRQQLNCQEIGVPHYPRVNGTSKVSLLDSARTLSGIMQLYRHYKSRPTAAATVAELRGQGAKGDAVKI